MSRKTLWIIALFILTLLSLYCASKRYYSPQIIDKRKLDYPLSALLEKVEGNVVVGVFVSEQGKAAEVRLLESSSNSELDNAAIKFAREMKFQPALLDNQPIGAWMKLVMKYKLTDVFFEENEWVGDVVNLLAKISKEQDSSKKEMHLKRLYTKYHGLVSFVNANPDDIRINNSIKKTLLPETKEKYDPFSNFTPIPFAVFDDFLTRFPESSIAAQAKKDLLKQLVEAQYRLRIKGLQSSAFSRKTLHLIDEIEFWIKELQKIDE